MLKKAAPYLLILFSAFLLVFIWFKDGYILATAESGLTFHNLQRNATDTAHAWSDLALGNSTGLLVATHPTFAVLSYLNTAGIPEYLIEAGVFFFLFTSSGVGIYLFCKELLPELSDRYLLLAVYFYWFSPLSLINIWHRFLINHMFIFAFMPIGIYLFYKGLNQKNYIYTLLLALVSLFFSFAFSSITFVVLFWGVASLFWAAWVIFSERKYKFAVSYFLLAVSLFLLVNLWWVSMLVSTLTSKSLTHSVSEFYSTSGNLDNLTVISHMLGDISSLFRFIHLPSYVHGQEWARLFLSTPLVIVLFTTTAAMLYVIYKKRSHHNIFILGLFFVLSIFLMKGNNPPFGEIFQYAFVRFFPLQLFRNPFEKFSFFCLLVATPIFAYSVKYFAEESARISSSKIYWIAILFVVFVFGYPFWSRDLFKNRLAVELPQILNYDVKIPEYYKAADSVLEGDADMYRFVSLPLGPEGLIFSWEKPYRGVDPYYNLFSMPNISNNTVVPFYFESVSNLVEHQLQSSFLDFFRFYSAKYLVFRKDVNYKSSKVAPPSTVDNRVSEWEDSGYLSTFFTSPGLNIYQIDDKLILPKVYVSNSSVFSNSYDAADFSNYTKDVVIENSQNYAAGNLLLTPETSYLYDERWDVSRLSDQDLLAKTFHAKHFPGEVLYPLILLKEKIESPPATDVDGSLIYKLGILGKRCGELYGLKEKGASAENFNLAESAYINTLKVEEKYFGKFLGRSDIAPFLKDSLLAQLTLLSRIGAVTAEHELRELLVSWKIVPEYSGHDALNKMVYRVSVPVDGDYTLKTSADPIYERWIVNSKPVEPVFTKDGGYQLALKRGDNELILPFPLDSIIKVEIAEANEKVYENSIPEYKVSLPFQKTIYLLDFDFRFQEGNEFLAKFTQNIDQENQPIYSALVKTEPGQREWRHFSHQFETTPGAISGILGFDKSKDQQCSYILGYRADCREIPKNFSVVIKNFSLKQVDYPDLEVVKNTAPSIKSDTLITARKIDDATYEVLVRKTGPESETLVFSEMYNDSWQAIDDTGMVLGGHRLVNFYANGWDLDKVGEYRVLLRFKPENTLAAAKDISLYSAAVLFGITMWLGVRRNEK